MKAVSETFISSTSWTEGVGTTAAVATLRKMQSVDVPGHVKRIGTLFQKGIRSLSEETAVPLCIRGHPALTLLGFDHAEKDALMTLLTVRMLDQGYLVASAFYPTLAHTEREVERFLDAARPVFEELAEAIEKGEIRKRIGGPVKQPPFGRLA